MAQLSVRRGGQTRERRSANQARKADVDPVRELPYWPAAKGCIQRPDRREHLTTCQTSFSACFFRGVHRRRSTDRRDALNPAFHSFGKKQRPQTAGSGKPMKAAAICSPIASGLISPPSEALSRRPSATGQIGTISSSPDRVVGSFLQPLANLSSGRDEILRRGIL